jgi:hypothetical protein
MNSNQLMAEYANLATLHDALAVLVGYKIITHEDRIRLTRKFMDDRPEFKEAVAKAMGGSVLPATSTRMKDNR